MKESVCKLRFTQCKAFKIGLVFSWEKVQIFTLILHHTVFSNSQDYIWLSKYKSMKAFLKTGKYEDKEKFINRM